MLSRNLTPEGLAKRSGVSWSSLKRFESTGLIALESLLKISLVLDCLVDFDKVCIDDDRGFAGKSLDEILSRHRDVGTRRKVGRLAWRDRQILFEFDSAFIDSGIGISPI